MITQCAKCGKTVEINSLFQDLPYYCPECTMKQLRQQLENKTSRETYLLGAIADTETAKDKKIQELRQRVEELEKENTKLEGLLRVETDECDIRKKRIRELEDRIVTLITFFNDSPTTILSDVVYRCFPKHKVEKLLSDPLCKKMSEMEKQMEVLQEQDEKKNLKIKVLEENLPATHKKLLNKIGDMQGDIIMIQEANDIISSKNRELEAEVAELKKVLNDLDACLAFDVPIDREHPLQIRDPQYLNIVFDKAHKALSTSTGNSILARLEAAKKLEQAFKNILRDTPIFVSKQKLIDHIETIINDALSAYREAEKGAKE